MTANEYLYNDKYAKTRIFRVNNPGEDYQTWKLEPIGSDVLSVSGESDLNGLFVLKAFVIKTRAKFEECYMDILLPERTSENVYIWVENQVIEKNRWEVEGDVIPQVAINHFGDHQLFYSKRNPELGIDVLNKGLNLVEKKFAIALDLAYVLRDEGKNEAAIAAFSIAIDEEGPANYFSFIERAQLLEKIGDHLKADEDWKVVENLVGTEELKYYKGT